MKQRTSNAADEALTTGEINAFLIALCCAVAGTYAIVKPRVLEALLETLPGCNIEWSCEGMVMALTVFIAAFTAAAYLYVLTSFTPGGDDSMC